MQTNFETYLTLPSTLSFFKAAKKYLAFCYWVIINQPPNVLEESRPILIDLYRSASKLQPIDGDFPQSWEAYESLPPDDFDHFAALFAKLIGPELRCQHLKKPLSNESEVSGFFVDEFFFDLYLTLKDNFGRMENMGTQQDIEIALRFFKHGFENTWGENCASLLHAMHTLNHTDNTDEWDFNINPN